MDRGDDPHADVNELSTSFHRPGESHSYQSGRGNRLLDGLARADWDLIEPQLQCVTLAAGQVLEVEGTRPSSIYFPVKAAVALEPGCGKAPLQFALIGRDGLIGTSLLLGGVAFSTARVQFEGTAWRAPADALEACVEKSPRLHRQLLTGVSLLLSRLSQAAWANGRGLVENRLAAWLLTAADCLDDDPILITHQALSGALGVRRPSVTMALQHVEGMGIVQHRRGRLRILDRQRLAALAGDCFTVRSKCDAAYHLARG